MVRRADMVSVQCAVPVQIVPVSWSMIASVQWSSAVQWSRAASAMVIHRAMFRHRASPCNGSPCNGHVDLYLRPPFSHTHHITSLPHLGGHSQLLFIGSLY